MNDKIVRNISDDTLNSLLPTLNEDFLRELPASPKELLKYATRRIDPVISENITYSLGQSMLAHRLSDEDYLKVFFQVVHTSFFRKEHSDNPTASVLISQTGAGKTNLRKLVLNKQPDSVIINPDLYKKYNPNVPKILKEDPTHLGALTGIDSYDHANNIMNFAIAKGYSLLYECAPSEKQGLIGVDLERLYSNSYDTNFHTLAVGDLPSSIAIHYRYETELKKNPFSTEVKLTDLKRHDESYRSVVSVLQDLPLEKTQIYRRGTVEEGMIPQNVINLQEFPVKSKEELLNYLKMERNKSNYQYVFNRKRPNFLEDFNIIKKSMEERNAPQEQFDQLNEVYDRYITFKYQEDEENER